jgi:hypothetical protein
MVAPSTHQEGVMQKRTAGWPYVGLAFAGVLATGCLPYTVASTARPVGSGEVVRTATWYAIPNAVELDDTVAHPMYGIDGETRFGLDDRSDVGIRLPSFAGAVVTYKRRLDGPSATPRPALAVMGGRA